MTSLSTASPSRRSSPPIKEGRGSLFFFKGPKESSVYKTRNATALSGQKERLKWRTEAFLIRYDANLTFTLSWRPPPTQTAAGCPADPAAGWTLASVSLLPLFCFQIFLSFLNARPFFPSVFLFPFYLFLFISFLYLLWFLLLPLFFHSFLLFLSSCLVVSLDSLLPDSPSLFPLPSPQASGFWSSESQKQESIFSVFFTHPHPNQPPQS